MSDPILWQERVLCIVTGASRGLGRAICIQFAKDFLQYHQQVKTQGDYKMIFLILARNASLLSQVQQELHALDKQGHIQTIDPIIGPIEDANIIQSFEQAIASFGIDKGINIDQAILVHNAGTLGNPNKLVTDYTSQGSEELIPYFNINLLSVIKLTASFLKGFHHTNQRMVINISSLCALKPFKGMALYCTGKAARDAFFRNVAEEDPVTFVLNYAPGPLLTDMAKELQTSGYMQEFYSDESNLLSCEDSVAKLFQAIRSGKVQSGSHIDVYDIN